MPIYAYRCASCGHAQDVLQRMSDPVLGICPACGAAAYEKQVTAAGFQLKGSGWYVTDFRGGNNAAKKDDKAADATAPAAADKGADKPAEKPAPTSAPTSADKSPEKAAAPASSPPAPAAGA